jgi:hypothetical protein
MNGGFITLGHPQRVNIGRTYVQGDTNSSYSRKLRNIHKYGIIWKYNWKKKVCICRTGSINLLKPSGNFTYHQVQHPQILRSAHTVYLCVLYGSQNKQQLLPYTALTDWFL